MQLIQIQRQRDRQDEIVLAFPLHPHVMESFPLSSPSSTYMSRRSRACRRIPSSLRTFYNDFGEDDDGDEDDDEIDLDPVLENYSIKHHGGINRVRSMPQRPEVIATWSETGSVNIFNVESVLKRFKAAEGKGPSSGEIPSRPYFEHTGHATEGYAMDWSPSKEGHLVTGDCSGNIHLWTPRPEGDFSVVPAYHADASDRPVDAMSSVEDLQWSPKESTVFASAEC